MWRLTSPLFSQESEVSANPFSASFSHSHSSIGQPRRDVNHCSSFEKSLTRSKRKSSRDSGSVQGSHMERVKDSVRTKRCSWFSWESWSSLSKRMRSSDKVIWSAVWVGQKRMENAKCWYSSVWHWYSDPIPEDGTLQANQLTDQTPNEKELAM